MQIQMMKLKMLQVLHLNMRILYKFNAGRTENANTEQKRKTHANKKINKTKNKMADFDKMLKMRKS